MLQNRWNLLDHETLKPALFHQWFNESNRLTQWFLHADSDWISFGSTTNLLSILDNFWMPTAVVLVQNALLLLPAGKVLELGFPKCF